MKNLDSFLNWFYEMNPHCKSIDCTPPENMFLPIGQEYRIVNHVLGWTEISDEQIYHDAPIVDGIIYIVLFDLMCPYDKHDNIFYVIDQTSTKFFELDRIQAIVENLELEGAIVLVNGYISSFLADKLKIHYPTIVLKNWSYVLYKDSEEMQIQTFTSDVKCNLISLLAGRPDVHRFWIANKLKRFNADQVKISEKPNAYDSETWNRLLHEFTGITLEYIENKNMIIDVPGYNTDNKFDRSIFEFTKSGAVSVVTETVFFYPTPWLTGRTLIPLSCARPFILTAPPHTLEFLRSLGFKTFDRWWDESYDTIEDPKLRMLKIFEVIDYVASLSATTLKNILDQMSSILNHNKEMVKKIHEKQIVNLNDRTADSQTYPDVVKWIEQDPPNI